MAEKIARTINIAYASRDIFLDHDQNRDAIDQQLKRMETIADKNNLVIAIGHPYATTPGGIGKLVCQFRSWALPTYSHRSRRKIAHG